MSAAQPGKWVSHYERAFHEAHGIPTTSVPPGEPTGFTAGHALGWMLGSTCYHANIDWALLRTADEIRDLTELMTADGLFERKGSREDVRHAGYLDRMESIALKLELLTELHRKAVEKMGGEKPNDSDVYATAAQTQNSGEA